MNDEMKDILRLLSAENSESNLGKDQTKEEEYEALSRQMQFKVLSLYKPGFAHKDVNELECV